MPNKLRSRDAGLRYIEEDSLNTLPGSGRVWRPLGVNSFGPFGPSYSRIARRIFKAGRGRLAGTIVDADYGAQFTLDVLQDNLTRLMQGVLWGTWNETPTTAPLDGTATTITNIDGTANEYDAADDLDIFVVGHIVLAEGFTNAENNGIKHVTSVSATNLGVAEDIVDETPPAGAKLTVVGFRFASATVNVDADGGTGGLPALERASGVVDWTTIGLSPGQPLYLGSDSAGSRFVNAVNRGWCRVKDIAAAAITLDKTQLTMTDETGTGLTIQLWFGHVLTDSNVRHSYHLEQALGEDDDGPHYQYVKGAVAGKASFNIQGQSKAEMQIDFVGMGYQAINGTDTPLSDGDTLPTLDEGDPFNTSVNVKRSKISAVSASSGNVTPFVAYARNMTIAINNGVEAAKAIGVLGGFDISDDDFMADIDFEGYFQSVDVFNDISNNQSLTFDTQSVKDNAGIAIDFPLMKGASDPLDFSGKDIMLKLKLEAAEDPALGYTMLYSEFPYLPDVAEV